MYGQNDTIIAPATTPGGALSIIRISGIDAITICDKCFRSPSNKKLSEQRGYTIHFGNIIATDGSFIDEVLVSIFRSPSSYTGENMVEISCHGSQWIVAEIIRTLTLSGARPANAGEFTVRAFLAGKLDLAQAEAVADMIATDNKASHSIAATQLRGKYSQELSALRGDLLRLASLLELELDFSEEDVTFADRGELISIIEKTNHTIESLSASFTLGNAIKKGVGVALIGNPNAGKSTLLNTILGDDRAMVSNIAGTTRDIIEEHFNINGIGFRFIDTAGIRHSNDVLEQMGIERTYKAAANANIILYMVDAEDKDISLTTITTALHKRLSSNHTSAQYNTSTQQDITKNVSNNSTYGDYVKDNEYFNSNNNTYSADCISDGNSLDEIKDSENIANKNNQQIAIIINKCDSAEIESKALCRFAGAPYPVIPISAKYGHNINTLKLFLTSTIDSNTIFGGDKSIVTNARHYDSLRQAAVSLTAARNDLSSNITSDLLAQDLRQAIHHIGTITGEITTNDILSEIFSKFCIGK